MGTKNEFTQYFDFGLNYGMSAFKLPARTLIHCGSSPNRRTKYLIVLDEISREFESYSSQLTSPNYELLQV